MNYDDCGFETGDLPILFGKPRKIELFCGNIFINIWIDKEFYQVKLDNIQKFLNSFLQFNECLIQKHHVVDYGLRGVIQYIKINLEGPTVEYSYHQPPRCYTYSSCQKYVYDSTKSKWCKNDSSEELEKNVFTESFGNSLVELKQKLGSAAPYFYCEKRIDSVQIVFNHLHSRYEDDWDFEGHVKGV